MPARPSIKIFFIACPFVEGGVPAASVNIARFCMKESRKAKKIGKKPVKKGAERLDNGRKCAKLNNTRLEKRERGADDGGACRRKKSEKSLKSGLTNGKTVLN